MRKGITVLLLLGLLLIITGCGGKSSKAADTTRGNEQKTTKNNLTDNANLKDSTNTSNSEGDTFSNDVSNKTLVVYFSNTGNTKKIANYIIEGLNADTYEITPQDPYTKDDLDYKDDNSRSSKEMNDASSRPEIANKLDNLDEYDTVYIGYPIWWGEAPRIMDTFVESYDFTGKVVIPFCTSGSSDIADSEDGLKKLAGTGEWKKGKRFSGSDSKEKVISWVNSIQ